MKRLYILILFFLLSAGLGFYAYKRQHREFSLESTQKVAKSNTVVVQKKEKPTDDLNPEYLQNVDEILERGKKVAPALIKILHTRASSSTESM